MSAPPPICQRYRIGYALSSKKVRTCIQHSLLDQAKQKGVDLVPVDLSKPLVDQGFFHCIVHKLYGQGWNEQLKDYASKYPNSVIVDPPERIEPLRSRISMLEVVSRLKIPQPQLHGRGSESESLAVPKQVVVQDSEGLESLELLLLNLGMKLPVLAKPVEANGSGTSHDLYLVINSKGLKSLTTPIVAQEFVNHGGVVFKVYVVGDHVECVKRRSLPDIPAPPPPPPPVADEQEEQISSTSLSSEAEEVGLLAFSQISNSAVQSEEDDGNVNEAEMPSVGFVEAVGRALRQELGLRLFNFDLIRDCTSGSGHRNSKNREFEITLLAVPVPPKTFPYVSHFHSFSFTAPVLFQRIISDTLEVAEAYGLLQALKLAEEEGWTKVCCISDAWHVIFKINKPNSQNSHWAAEGIFKDIWRLAKKLQNVFFTWSVTQGQQLFS